MKSTTEYIQFLTVMWDICREIMKRNHKAGHQGRRVSPGVAKSQQVYMEQNTEALQNGKVTRDKGNYQQETMTQS